MLVLSPRLIRRIALALVLISSATFLPGASAVSCSVSQSVRFPETNLPDADAAIEKGKAEDAIPIYLKALTADPANPALNAALAEAYLDAHKTPDADAVLAKAVAAHPHSAVLETVLAEAQAQEGRPWDAQDTISNALADDPCYPDAHLEQGQLFTFMSMRGSAAKQYAVAYQLAPHDSAAFDAYLRTLAPAQRIATIRTFVGREKLTPEAQKSYEDYAARLEKEQSQPAGACTLMPSSTETTEIPLIPLMGDGQHVKGAGLDVKIEQHSVHLEIDTGAGGLVISTAAAAKAGLQYARETTVHGIGNSGATTAHVAYAQSIRIGALEFHDCPVTIYDRKRLHTSTGDAIDEDNGVIGMDTLRQFLVTLDYPHGKLRLAPLPAIPNVAAEPVSLNTAADNPDSPHAATTQSSSNWHDRYIAPEMKDYSSAYRVGHDFVVPASIGKDKIRLFILDTGAFRTIVSTEAASSVGKLHRDTSGLEIYGLSGMVKDIYYVDQMTFNFARVGLVTNQAIALDPTSLSFYTMPMEISGLIGASALRQCVVHLDYRDGLVKLDYTPGPSRF